MPHPHPHPHRVRRAWAGLAVVASLPWSLAAFAQATSNAKPVELIVPYTAGGGVSNMARAFAGEASKDTGQQWIVTNKEGAGGLIGFSALVKSPTDGNTIVFSPASPLTNSPFTVASMPFKLDQVQPVCQVFENVFTVAVRDESPIKTFAQLIDKARAAPGTVSYGHAGIGSVGHLSMAAVERALKVKFNPIAYRGDGALLADTMGGTIDFSAPAISSIAGKNMRVLAVLASERQASMPDVPSIAELGVPAVTPGLNGLFVPAGTPRDVVARLQGVCARITASSAYADEAKVMLQVPKYLDAAAFKARIDTAYKVNAELVPGLNLEKN